MVSVDGPDRCVKVSHKSGDVRVLGDPFLKHTLSLCGFVGEGLTMSQPFTVFGASEHRHGGTARKEALYTSKESWITVRRTHMIRPKSLWELQPQHRWAHTHKDAVLCPYLVAGTTRLKPCPKGAEALLIRPVLGNVRNRIRISLDRLVFLGRASRFDGRLLSGVLGRAHRHRRDLLRWCTPL